MAPVDSLLFEAAEKAFCHSIIETIASAAHTTHKSVYFQKLPVFPAGILGGYRSRQTSGRIRFELVIPRGLATGI